MTTVSQLVQVSGRLLLVEIDVSLSLLFAEDLVLKNPETYLFILDKHTQRVVYHPLISNPTDVKISREKH